MFGFLRRAKKIRLSHEALMNCAYELAKAQEHHRLMDHQLYGAATNTYFPEFKPLDCAEIHPDKTHDVWMQEKKIESIMNSGPDGPL